MRKEFERVTPEEMGIPSEKVIELVEAFESGYTEMHGLMIMRHGKVLSEGWWAPYAPGMHHMCASLTKTYMGTAIGMAIHDGLLTLDTKLTDIFPEFTPEEPSEYIDELTVRSVLCMGTGMTAFPSMEGNWVKNYIAMPLHHKPLTSFFYNSVGSTFLGKIILKLTGKDVYEYLNEKLFDHIGIDGENIDYGVAPDGQDMWAWRTISTTEDNLRLMKLYADGGVADGVRLLDEEYVKLATTKQIDNARPGVEGMSDSNAGYGFQMWMCNYPDTYRADGAAGQFSIVIPGKDMIISINEKAKDPSPTLQNIWDILMPAVSDEPLPENPDSLKKLQKKMKHLCIEAPEYAPYSPVKESACGRYWAVSGNFHPYCAGMYAPEANPVRLVDISFDVMEGKLHWMSKDRTEVTVEFALDGSRRYNRFASPWQFATIAYANGYWKSEQEFLLQILWPENNSTKELTLVFEDGKLTVKETVGGLPGQPLQTVETVLVKK